MTLSETLRSDRIFRPYTCQDTKTAAAISSPARLANATGHTAAVKWNRIALEAQIAVIESANSAIGGTERSRANASNSRRRDLTPSSNRRSASIDMTLR